MASVIKAVLYSRCSTNESRQDTENQLLELRRYCTAFGWSFDEVSEYDSGFKGTQPKLQAVLEKIRRKEYDTVVVFSLDRFSREHPSKVNALLDQIVYQYGCRFISLQESLDSQNEMIWAVIKPLFSWFAHVYSRNLSEKIKAGIRNKREKGLFRGGRPRKEIDLERLRAILVTDGRLPLRVLETRYNTGIPKAERLSYATIRKVLPSL